MDHNTDGKVLLTEESLEQLRQRYEELIAKRKEIAGEIREAKDFGDLSENTEFTAARESQSHLQTEILEIKAILENYNIFKEDKKSKNTITIGTNVKFEYLDTNEVEEIKIVTIADTNPLEGKISNESPLGKALLGNKKNSVVTIHTPDGPMDVKVLDISK